MVVDPIKNSSLRVPIRANKLRDESTKRQKAILADNQGAYIVGNKGYQKIGHQYKGRKINVQEIPGIRIDRKYSLPDIEDQIKTIVKLKEQQDALFDTLDREGNYQLEHRRIRYDALDIKIAQAEKELFRIATKVECNEKTAQQIAWIGFQAHQRGQLNSVSLYAVRQVLEKLGFEHFVRGLDIFDTFQYAPDKQHTDAEGDISGTKTATQILSYMLQKHGPWVIVDGMVAPYLSSLSDQDIIFANYKAYAEVYKKRQIDHIDLRLEGGTLLDIAKIYVLFSQANRIYLELNLAASLNSLKGERGLINLMHRGRNYISTVSSSPVDKLWILVVCNRNLERSPIVAKMISMFFGDRVIVKSAGLEAPSLEDRQVCNLDRERYYFLDDVNDYFLKQQMPRRVNAALITEADIIFVMTHTQKEALNKGSLEMKIR